MQTRPCPTCAEPWGFAFHSCPYDRTPLPPLQPAPRPQASVRPVMRRTGETERQLRAVFHAANELRRAG